MAVSESEFLVELYHEHVDEAAFLYVQRIGLFDDPEVDWPDIGDFEQRLEAHIDALVLGGEPALKICRERSASGEPGDLFAAMSVFCRQDRRDHAQEALESIDPESSDCLQAAGDALKHEAPQEWTDLLLGLLADPRFSPLITEALGFRRIRTEPVAMKDSPALRKIWALGRLRMPGTEPLLREYTGNPDAQISLSACLALLRMGDRDALNDCARAATREPWRLIPFALGGDRSCLDVVSSFVKNGRVDEFVIMALGLLGDASSVDALLDRLADPGLAETCALALELITGAGITEKAFIPEEIREDELFEEELKAFREDGKMPVRPDGEPYGVTVTRLSLKQEDWRAWWKENSSRFRPQVRHRTGRPLSPMELVGNLASLKSPNSIRRLAGEELVIRYGLDVPFEVEMFVADQMKALDAMAVWARDNSSRFRPGDWYFAGQPLG